MSHPGEKNLNTFRILFLIKGILDFLIIFIGVFYAAMGSLMGNVIRHDAVRTGQDIPFDPSYIFIAVGIIIVFIGLGTSIPAIMASQRFSQKRGRSFIIIAAAINCLTGVLGIILCVFTVIELQKPAVKEVFAANDGK